jgi:hypothetical protein
MIAIEQKKAIPQENLTFVESSHNVLVLNMILLTVG